MWCKFHEGTAKMNKREGGALSKDIFDSGVIMRGG